MATCYVARDWEYFSCLIVLFHYRYESKPEKVQIVKMALERL